MGAVGTGGWNKCWRMPRGPRQLQERVSGGVGVGESETWRDVLRLRVAGKWVRVDWVDWEEVGGRER